MIFDSTASRPRHGLALVYDLEGFSKFVNQPDVQGYVPKFLNEVSRAMSICISGGEAYWDNNIPKPEALGMVPVHEKFLGDGALYLWVDNNDKQIESNFVQNLCNRVFNLKTMFPEVLKKCHEFVPVVDLPQRIRFGLARGTIYELRRKNSSQREYIGFCINLASRLQKYCMELGFIASARLELPDRMLKQNGYVKVVATQIKGFPREIVIVDADEFKALNPEIKDHLFETL